MLSSNAHSQAPLTIVDIKTKRILMPLQDLPITSTNQDRFGRVEAAKRCADTLISIRSETAFVVGLAGQWGSGKTSFVNMVKEAIHVANDKTIVISFNAWLYSSQEQLLKQFFSEVGHAVDTSAVEKLGTSTVKELGTALNEYAEIISEKSIDLASTLFSQLFAMSIAVPYAGTAGKYVLKRAAQKAGAALKGSDKSIEQLRAEISKRLSELDENVVVIIDDIDRLPKEDICAIFKLVNLTASFPRMTYLLSYDAAVVRKALSDIQGIDGSSYLEKIVHYPMDLPKPSIEALETQLEEVLVPYLETMNFKMFGPERSRLVKVFDSLVLRRIETPRQVKRFLNRFEVMRSGVGEEVCHVDIIGMTGIALFYPSAANWLWTYRNDACTSLHPSYDFGDAKIVGLKASLEQAIAEDAGDERIVIDALSVLFPKILLLLQMPRVFHQA